MNRFDTARALSQEPLSKLRRALSGSNDTDQEKGVYRIPMPYFKFMERKDDVD